MSKCLLISMLIVTLVGSLVGGGLFAHFTDAEQSTENTFQAGSIDLKVDGQDYVVTENVGPLKPCEWYTWDKHFLSNAGTLPGILSVKLDITAKLGGENPEPERAALDTANAYSMDPYLEIIVVSCTADDLLPIVQGSVDFHEAFDRLVAAGYGGNLLYEGLLNKFNGIWKFLGNINPGAGHNFQVLVHLQQPASAGNVLTNKMMGDYCVVNKTFSLDQIPCGEPPPGGGKFQNLPTGDVTVQLHNPGTSSYWAGTFSGVPAGYDVANGVYKVWCIDEEHSIGNNSIWTVRLISSLNPLVYTMNINWGYQPPHPNIFNYVNWIINTYEVGASGPGVASASITEMQTALWYFIDHTTYASLSGDAKTIVDQALLNGTSFVPATGQMAAVVLYDPDKLNFQICIVEIDP